MIYTNKIHIISHTKPQNQVSIIHHMTDIHKINEQFMKKLQYYTEQLKTEW